MIAFASIQKPSEKPPSVRLESFFLSEVFCG